MKTIITIVFVLLAGLMLTSCDESTGGAPPPPAPPGPNPVTVLEVQVESERQARQEAEAKAEKAEAKVEEATVGKGRWQLAALGLAVITVIAFVGGTAIGSSSRGSIHESATS